MKIMIPLAGGVVCAHFGHCQEFALLDVDPRNGEIGQAEFLTPPPHEPGVLPRWIAEQGTDMVLAGGMGQKAKVILEKNNVQVLTGTPGLTPEQAVAMWHKGELNGDANFCDH